MKLIISAFFFALLSAAAAAANPYLPKPGDRPITIRLATSAVSGGFVHLYSALDYGIFEKYGFKPEHIYIRGQSPALAALANDELQFNYGAADGSLPGLAAGVEVKVIASPLVKLPYVLVARKDIRRPEDLKGKAIGVTRPGDLSARLSRAVVKKFGLTTDDVTIRPIGGSQTERYQAMLGNVVQAILVTPPLDVRAKNDGFNILYRLIDLDLPFIYSSLMTNYKMLRERPEIVQRMVAALAESVYFVEKNPDKAKAAIAKAMRTKDEEALQVSYNVYAKEIVDRTMVVPGKSVSETVEIARETGTVVRRKAEELYDNSFVNNLERSGFLKELWGGENYRR
jgi:NitT/TauT family transport system substrate-binding protein